MEKRDERNGLRQRKKKTLLGQLRDMQPGDTLTFPISRLSYVRFACSAFSAEWERTYSTRILREQRQVQATRVR